MNHYLIQLVIIMIISRTPLRVSLFGGGTDFYDYYSKFGGNFFSFAIDKYIYISAHSLVDSSDILLKYSKTERVEDASEIEHPVFREICLEYNLKKLDFSVSSDVPAKTGLGSSSAFTVGLLNTVRCLLKMDRNPNTLVKEACKIEISKLNEPIGVQDQNAVAFGGVAKYEILKDGTTKRYSYANYEYFKEIVSKNFILIRISGNRNLSSILNEQKRNLLAGHSLEHLHSLNNLGLNSMDIVSEGPKVIGQNLQLAWHLKKKLANQISNSELDSIIDNYIKSGFYGAKLLGAGSSGYLLLVGPERKIGEIRESKNIQSLQINLDDFGSTIIYEM